ncbi:MAG: peptide ABC transporter substrate-binding protein [Opitutus sp.]
MGTVTGCARRQTAAEQGVASQTLLIGNQNEPASLDPHVVDAYTDAIVLSALFEGLATLEEQTSKALPGVAESWDVTPDGMEYTFHLRATARWSNGDPVTARDFVFGFQRILTPAFGASYAAMLWPIRNAERFNKGELTDFSEVGASVLDDHTLRLRLERPTPYLPALTAHQTWMPVHRATIEKFGRTDDRNTRWTRAGNMVSNGPFVLTEWSPNARIVVSKNPHYWGAAQTALEHIIFFPTEKADVEDLDFRAGQLHITYDVPKSKIAAYRAAAPELLRIEPLLNTLYVNFNVTKPPFTDARVRQALALAIDREAIAKNVMYGSYLAADSLVPPNCGGYLAAQGVRHNFAEARRLLADAGFPQGARLPEVSMQVLNDATYPRIAEAIQAMWRRELGVRITIEPLEQKTWIQNQQTMSHSLALMGWVADFADPVSFLDIFRANNGNNWSGWKRTDYDQLLDEAGQMLDPAARFDAFRRAESLLLADAPITPLLFLARTYRIHPAVKNWDPAPLGAHRFARVKLAE